VQGDLGHQSRSSGKVDIGGICADRGRQVQANSPAHVGRVSVSSQDFTCDPHPVHQARRGPVIGIDYLCHCWGKRYQHRPAQPYTTNGADICDLWKDILKETEKQCVNRRALQGQRAAWNGAIMRGETKAMADLAEYHCAIVGCGARGIHQAEMLEAIPEMELVAACDVAPEPLQQIRDRFGGVALYTDLEAMLSEQQIDIVHLMTLPNVRVEPVVKAARAGVKAVTIEKPIALLPSEARAITAAAHEAGCLIAANHQRRYMPYCEDLHQVLASGLIGEIRFARCSTNSNSLLEMGPHMVDLLLMMLGDRDPLELWATSVGADGFNNAIKHNAPCRTLARVLFPGDLEVLFIHSHDTIGTWGESTLYSHLELDFWGTQGRAWYTQNEGWGYHTRGMAQPSTGPTSWANDNEAAQQEFTRAVGRWIADPAVGHRCSLEHSLRGFEILMGMMKSSLTGQPWQYGDDVSDKDIAQLQALLAEREGAASGGSVSGC